VTLILIDLERTVVSYEPQSRTRLTAHDRLERAYNFVFRLHVVICATREQYTVIARGNVAHMSDP
jgi:hypothetical protein